MVANNLTEQSDIITTKHSNIFHKLQGSSKD